MIEGVIRVLMKVYKPLSYVFLEQECPSSVTQHGQTYLLFLLLHKHLFKFIPKLLNSFLIPVLYTLLHLFVFISFLMKELSLYSDLLSWLKALEHVRSFENPQRWITTTDQWSENTSWYWMQVSEYCSCWLPNDFYSWLPSVSLFFFCFHLEFVCGNSSWASYE